MSASTRKDKTTWGRRSNRYIRLTNVDRSRQGAAPLVVSAAPQRSAMIRMIMGLPPLTGSTKTKLKNDKNVNLNIPLHLNIQE